MKQHPLALPASALLLCGDEEIHDLAEHWLTTAGMRVVTAHNGKQAEKLISDAKIEVLVVDCLPIYVPDLPDLHRLKEGRKLCIVMIPRVDQKAEVGLARISGIDAILERPLHKEALLTALKVL
jgi:DNA-binding response OmpR family regulator